MLVATNVEDERKALALGADAYCAKPLSRASLLAQLDAVVARNVLVIDDDPAARYVYQKLLTDPRTHVVEAVDGHSGLVAARAAQPVMIFLDLNLPDTTGEDVLAAIRRDSTLKKVPGRGRDLTRAVARGAGAPGRTRTGRARKERAQRRPRPRDSLASRAIEICRA